MVAACQALNGDAPAVATVRNTQCSANVQFPFPLRVNSQRPAAVLVPQLAPAPQPPASRSNASGSINGEEDVVKTTVAAIGAIVKSMDDDLANIALRSPKEPPLQLLADAAKGHPELQTDLTSATVAYNNMKAARDACERNREDAAKRSASTPNIAATLRELSGEVSRHGSEFNELKSTFSAKWDNIIKQSGV